MASISPIRDSKKQITHFVAVKEDITELRAAQDELNHINFLSDSALDLTRSGYWEIDYNDPDFYTSSERAVAIFGEPPKEEHRYHLMDEWYSRIVAADPEIAEKTGEHYRAAVEGRIPLYDATYPYKRPIDGRIVWIRAIGSVVRDEDGTARHMYGVAQDITESKLVEEDLRLARKAAVEANQAKSKFLANMSHELRTPMNAIIGYSEMLIEEAEDLEQDEFIPDLKRIHGAGRHLLALINDILDLSKIEAGKMELFLENFNIEHMLDEINSTVDTLVKKKNNKFVVDYTSHLGDMYSDLTKVRQSLFNLISNAAKFTENGSVTLSVKQRTVDNQELIEFRVSDTGIGIAEDKLGILFDEFTQADDSTTRNYGGTGLGLAITKRFCEMMGGTISVESKIGKGSTFTICLPISISSPEEEEDISDVRTEEAESSPAESSQEPSTVKAVSNTILVIDDDPNMQDMMTKFLRKEGYQVVTASSGDEGLRLARELHPVAITLDVLMPHMDGWKVLKLLKSDTETRNIPVIILTVVSDTSVGLSLGATECLSKPVDRDHLLQILNRICPGKSSKPILVVEDDARMREMLSRILVKEGWKVTEAANGRIAIEQVSREIPGMILLDLLMPVMDGFAFLRELRKEANWRDIPVLVITSKDITQEERQLLNDRVVTVLKKGAYTREELLEQVSSAIKQFIPKSDQKRD
jgi:signal transduction histidine kinase/CheY-like chemotaxis protein